MKRVQLFEFEDFTWFPSVFRSTMTKLIVVMHRLLGTKEVIASLLKEVQKEYSFSKIIDLGSGSGGIMPTVIDYLNESEHKIKLMLSDLHPNKEFVENFNKQNHNNISYLTSSLDASTHKEKSEGLKTMMNSFHHMQPKVAKAILKNAQDNKQAILIYEMAENKMPFLVWFLLLPISLTILMLMSLFLLPFVKPLNWKDVLFTYILPVIPIFYAWDGQASMPRMYSFEDIKEELLPLKNENYKWKIDVVKKENGKSLGYYILGLPDV